MDFWAEWCPPCKAMNPMIEELEKEFAGKVEFVKYNVEEHKELTQKYVIMAIPAYIIEKDGKEVARTSGTRSKEEFRSWIKEQL